MSSAVGKRRRPRPLVQGKQAEIRPAELDELLGARADLDRAKLRLRRVTTRLERALGDAEFATIDGVPVLWREQARTGGHYVRVNNREDLRVIGRATGPACPEPDRRPRDPDSPVGEARAVAPVLRFSPPAQALVDRILDDE